MLQSIGDHYQCSRRTFCLHLQGRSDNS